MALLTLSLNAQLKASNKADTQPTAKTEKADMPLEGIKKASKPARLRAPKRATETNSYSYTFTSTQFTANGTKELGGVSWTLAGDGGYWGYDNTKGQQFGSGGKPYKSLTLSSSGIDGTIKSITVNASTASGATATMNVTVGGTSFISNQSLTTTATDYSGTGSASGDVVISMSQTTSKALYIKSIAITYETETGGGDTPDTELATLNVFIDTTRLVAEVLPVYGYWHDANQHNQMVYPASMLTDMVGSKIVEIKFYPERMKMNGGVVTLSLMTTDQVEYTEQTLLTGLTPIATATPVKGSREFIFTFDEPFEYTGGNLVVDALVTTAGQMNLESSTFYGVATEYWASLEAWSYYGYNVGFVSFLPKATFLYQQAEPQWDLGDVNHDHFVNVSDVTLLISYILNGGASGFYITEANCNGDVEGAINVADVTALIATILGN